MTRVVAGSMLGVPRVVANAQGAGNANVVAGADVLARPVSIALHPALSHSSAQMTVTIHDQACPAETGREAHEPPDLSSDLWIMAIVSTGVTVGYAVAQKLGAAIGVVVIGAWGYIRWRSAGRR
jgi:hypothetical protein